MENIYSEKLQQNLTIQEKIGEGAFGITYLVIDENNQNYVLKVLKLKDVDRWRVVERFHREIAVLKQLDYPGIPKFYDSIETDEVLGIVQEYIAGETLQSIITGHTMLKRNQWVNCFEQGLDILTYLKSFQPPVIHRDISPKNMMFGADDVLYLIDFGGVQLALTENSETITTLGTFGYMAPEQIMGITSPQSDLFSFGMSMIAVANKLDASNFPFDLETGRVDFKQIFQEIDPYYHDILKRICHPAAKKREITAYQIEENHQNQKSIVVKDSQREIEEKQKITSMDLDLIVGDQYTLYRKNNYLNIQWQERSGGFKSIVNIYGVLMGITSIFMLGGIIIDSESKGSIDGFILFLLVVWSVFIGGLLTKQKMEVSIDGMALTLKSGEKTFVIPGDSFYTSTDGIYLKSVNYRQKDRLIMTETDSKIAHQLAEYFNSMVD